MMDKKIAAALDPLFAAHVDGKPSEPRWSEPDEHGSVFALQTPRMAAENEFVLAVIEWMEANTDYSRYDS